MARFGILTKYSQKYNEEFLSHLFIVIVLSSSLSAPSTTHASVSFSFLCVRIKRLLVKVSHFHPKKPSPGGDKLGLKSSETHSWYRSLGIKVRPTHRQ